MRVYSRTTAQYLNWLKFILLVLVVPVITYLEYGVKPIIHEYSADYYLHLDDEETLEPASSTGTRFFRHIKANLSHNRNNSSTGKHIKFQLDSFTIHESLHFKIDRVYDDFIGQGHHYAPEWIQKAQHVMLFRQTLF